MQRALRLNVLRYAKYENQAAWCPESSDDVQLLMDAIVCRLPAAGIGNSKTEISIYNQSCAN